MSAHPFAGYIDELAAHLGCDQQHIADACAGREYLRRELVDPACAFLKSRKVKVKAADIDPLGRVYTPDWLADEMARIAAIVVPDPYVVVDPCCGDGALLEAALGRFPEAPVTGIDLDPEARGLALHRPGTTRVPQTGDYLQWDDSSRAHLPSIYLINPPYDDVGWRILAKAVAADPEVVVALVPLAWTAHRRGRDLLYGKRPATAIPVLGRPWDRLREAVILVWAGSGLDGWTALPRCVERPKGVRSEP